MKACERDAVFDIGIEMERQRLLGGVRVVPEGFGRVGTKEFGARMDTLEYGVHDVSGMPATGVEVIALPPGI